MPLHRERCYLEDRTVPLCRERCYREDRNEPLRRERCYLEGGMMPLCRERCYLEGGMMPLHRERCYYEIRKRQLLFIAYSTAPPHDPNISSILHSRWFTIRFFPSVRNTTLPFSKALTHRISSYLTFAHFSSVLNEIWIGDRPEGNSGKATIKVGPAGKTLTIRVADESIETIHLTVKSIKRGNKVI